METGQDLAGGGVGPRNPPQSHVEIVSSPNHSNDNPDVHLVEDELREGLESSRQLVRRSRYLIELSGSDGASSGDDDECSIAN